MRPSHSRRPAKPVLVALSLLLASTLLMPIAQTKAGPGQPNASSTMPTQFAIHDQLMRGDIDYPTSLLYRAYAYFGDNRLPKELRGNGRQVDDHWLFGELHESWSTLPKQTQDLLIPFTVRPTDSRSRYFAPGAPNDSPNLTSPVYQAAGDCSDSWASKDSQRFQFKVWVHCEGDYDGDMDAAIAMIEDFWERQVGLMGEPVYDTGTVEEGGDTRIDFYYVDDEADIVDRNGGDSINAEAAAHAAPSEPYIGKAASGYMVGRRPVIREETTQLVLAHEFFHIQQNGYNNAIAFGFKGSPYTSDFDILTFAEFWFVEATADWVMSYNYRDTASPDVMFAVYGGFYLYGFQSSDEPLYYSPRQWSDDFSHIYGASVYFLFLEQQFGPEIVQEFWDKIRDVEVDDFTRTTKILDDIYSFKDHFRDFAVMNLNLDLQPGDPITPSFRDLDPTFPEGSAPEMDSPSGKADRLNDTPITYDVAINSLSARYYALRIDDNADGFTLDFSDLAPSDALDVDLLVKVRDGDWERRQIDPTSALTYCRENPDDDISFVYVVLTNHDLVESTRVGGDFTANTVATPCA